MQKEHPEDFRRFPDFTIPWFHVPSSQSMNHYILESSLYNLITSWFYKSWDIQVIEIQFSGMCVLFLCFFRLYCPEYSIHAVLRYMESTWKTDFIFLYTDEYGSFWYIDMMLSLTNHVFYASPGQKHNHNNLTYESFLKNQINWS